MATLLHKNLGNKNPFEIQVWYKQTKQMKRSISFVIFLWKKIGFHCNWRACFYSTLINRECVVKKNSKKTSNPIRVRSLQKKRSKRSNLLLNQSLNRFTRWTWNVFLSFLMFIFFVPGYLVASTMESTLLRQVGTLLKLNQVRWSYYLLNQFITGFYRVFFFLFSRVSKVWFLTDLNWDWFVV